MPNLVKTQGLAAALAVEFGAAIEAVLGHALTVTPGPAPAGRGWAVPITAGGALTGTLTVYLDTAGVRAIAMQMMHLEEEPEDSVVIDMLKELWSQAASATALRDDFRGVSLSAGAPLTAAIDAGIGAWTVRAVDAPLATLAVGGLVMVSAASAPSAPSAIGTGPASAVDQGNLAALLDIDLPLVVRFARTELTLRALTMLGPGSMVDMGRSPDDPVQLLVGSQVIAEGEVVVVGGNYGVRITSLVSPAERLRAMEL